MIARPVVIGTAQDCTLAELIHALEENFRSLGVAITNVKTLLDDAGYSGFPGDTTDDLRVSFAMHCHLVQQFKVKVRTVDSASTFCASAISAGDAYQTAADQAGDVACGITVTPIDQDTQAMEAARRALKIAMPLEAARKVGALDVALQSYARAQRRRNTSDFKRLAGNDRD